jgi:hypothetical protein
MVRPGARTPPHYDQLEVSELFCPRCRTARPVRKHLLLVLPDGNRYEYRCGVCGASVGEKRDDDRSQFESILRAT